MKNQHTYQFIKIGNTKCDYDYRVHFNIPTTHTLQNKKWNHDHHLDSCKWAIYGVFQIDYVLHKISIYIIIVNYVRWRAKHICMQTVLLRNRTKSLKYIRHTVFATWRGTIITRIIVVTVFFAKFYVRRLIFPTKNTTEILQLSKICYNFVPHICFHGGSLKNFAL